MGEPMAEYWVVTGHADGMWHGTSRKTWVSLMLQGGVIVENNANRQQS
jgi:hypothetical protein